MSKMSRDKGQRAEREVIKLLQPIVDRVYGAKGLEPPTLERNLQQAASGGYDIKGLEWLALEVKRCEQLNLNKWWEQTVRQACGNKIPVLFYRQNRKAWRVRVEGRLPLHKDDFVAAIVDIGLEEFLVYLYHLIEQKISVVHVNIKTDMRNPDQIKELISEINNHIKP